MTKDRIRTDAATVGGKTRAKQTRCSRPQCAQRKRNRGAKLIGGAQVLLLVSCFVFGTIPEASALLIQSNFVTPGSTFPGTSRIADPAPTTLVGGGNLQDVFAAAADAWESHFADPYALTINYGWDNFTFASGVTSLVPGGIDPTTGRINQANIRFSNFTPPGQPGFFADPTPSSNEEYGQVTATTANLGGGTINTERTVFAVQAPPRIPALPGGANPDLYTLALHEIGHALNVENALAGHLAAADLGADGDADITRGPFAGTEIPWIPDGGGHAFVWLPDGQMLMNGGQVTNPPPPGSTRGAHRTLISDADVVLAAEASDFKRINLEDLSYVALPDFSDTSVLTLNGDAQQAGPVLRLTPDEASKAGSAFLTQPFDFTPRTGFETMFEFTIGGVNDGGPLGSDGMAFVMHSDPDGATSIGNAGEGLGFGINDATPSPVNPISPSIAIEFDTHRNTFPLRPGSDPNDNHVAFIANGDVSRHGSFANAPFTLNDGTSLFAWIDFDPIRDLFEVYVSDAMTKPAVPLLSDVIDLFGGLGPEVFFGFTAATGGGFNTHDILGWNLVVAQAPEPGSLALFAIGLGALGFAMRRRRSNA